MRALVLDELYPEDLEKVTQHLEGALISSGMEGVFWLELPPDLLTPQQSAHKDCGPHRLALVVEEGSLRLEFLVRAAGSMRCTCTGYATRAQREFGLGFVDRMIEELDIKT